MHSRAPVPQVANWQSLSLLLVEDDRADAVLVEELIADTVADIRVVWAESMAHAERELAAARPDCVLLDLHLPDAHGIEALDRIAKHDDTVPIVVLTGLNDEYFGASAVAAGAQDYLVKGRVEPDALRRALLYAIERKRAELIAADLRASQLRARENALLERGLLPSPLLHENSGVEIVTRYRPSREDALLCGDFYDVVQTPDRTVHVVIGDVAGHGPNEAALGAALRIAWRALTLAGVHGAELMAQLERVLHAERAGRGIFVTVLNLDIPGGTEGVDDQPIAAIRAGHPGMLVHGAGTPGTVEWIVPPGGRALGLRADDWPQHELVLPAGHGLVLLTDGLFEGYSGRGTERLGEDGLLALARTHANLPGPAFVDALIDGAQQLAQPLGGLTDDIAVVRVERTAE
ncbi:fused response regulator/phosphatase [Mycobacterium sp. 1164966.3]|uniref:PP2C family protein-serine/threonine phosphatase n=1 Tax=Mycobacterium sp. 1164966.3 TaxID=1856861 RepID=UPI0007FD4877|nr:SpoIIE family protein phosphatase [Mycobacterium sp. 1164966.3]OBA83188.1 fused response regulator/phosphatase [Mycobacterium sp. 1164966.3]